MSKTVINCDQSPGAKNLLAAIVYKKRKKLGLTLEQFSEKSEISVDEIKSLEDGLLDIRLVTRCKISDSLDLPFEMVCSPKYEDLFNI